MTYDVPSGRFKTQTSDEIVYVRDGNIYIGEATDNILVGSAADLDLLLGFTPGSRAHTAGWKKIWE